MQQCAQKQAGWCFTVVLVKARRGWADLPLEALQGLPAVPSLPDQPVPLTPQRRQRALVLLRKYASKRYCSAAPYSADSPCE
jgi:hypothetical protein